MKTQAQINSDRSSKSKASAKAQKLIDLIIELDKVKSIPDGVVDSIYTLLDSGFNKEVKLNSLNSKLKEKLNDPRSVSRE